MRSRNNPAITVKVAKAKEPRIINIRIYFLERKIFDLFTSFPYKIKP